MLDEKLAQAPLILLAEDDPADQELTRRALEKSRIPARLFVVQDGEETLDYVYHREKYGDHAHFPRPNLLLLDLNMPKVDGFEVLEKMKKDHLLQPIPVVVLTTSHREQDVETCYRLGANSYVTKPARLQDFMRAMLNLSEYWFWLVTLPAAPRPDSLIG